jgi:hypothetical protein
MLIVMLVDPTLSASISKIAVCVAPARTGYDSVAGEIVATAEFVVLAVKVIVAVMLAVFVAFTYT